MPEAEQVALYFLFGQNTDTEPDLYIGQTGTLRDRLKLHEKERTFWNRAVVIVTTTHSLTQTHALFLEWRSISEAKNAGRYVLLNGNGGARPYTPAPLEADCEEIFETARTLLATLGHPVFEPLIKNLPAATTASIEPERQIFYCKASDANGRGVFTDEGFVVLANSSGRRDVVPSSRTTDEEFRERLITDRVIQIEGDRLVFAKDYLFGTLSKAATILMGRAANGWIDWKTADGRTADEIFRKDQAIPVSVPS